MQRGPVSLMAQRAGGGCRPRWPGSWSGWVYAAISVYWAVGGRWLLNTVGIWLSQPGQAGHLAALLAVCAAAAVKAVAAVLPLLAIGVEPRTATVPCGGWLAC
jgi:hypothetical protein